MNIALILEKKYPQTQWALNGYDYAGLEWLDESPKPTEADLKTHWVDVEYEVAYIEVQKQREAAYAIESDPLKYRWEETLDPDDHAVFISTKASIRERYPYPEPPRI